MAGKSLVILGHNSHLVLDIREGNAQKLVEEFEGPAELVEDVEEVIKDHIFVFFVLFHDLVGVLDHSLN